MMVVLTRLTMRIMVNYVDDEDDGDCDAHCGSDHVDDDADA